MNSFKMNSFEIMNKLANAKIVALKECVNQLKDGSGMDSDSIFELIDSIHKDEMDLISALKENENEKENKIKKEIQLVKFMQ